MMRFTSVLLDTASYLNISRLLIAFHLKASELPLLGEKNEVQEANIGYLHICSDDQARVASIRFNVALPANKTSTTFKHAIHTCWQAHWATVRGLVTM
jgi:hypothetical protein